MIAVRSERGSPHPDIFIRPGEGAASGRRDRRQLDLDAPVRQQAFFEIGRRARLCLARLGTEPDERKD
jgi:hypothetical protein